MWKFLTELIKLIQSIPWRKLWAESKKIPYYLKCTLIVVVSVWVTYFGYQKFIDVDDIQSLQEDVQKLTERINATVESQDYKDDLVYLISAIKILENVEGYAYQEEQAQLELIRKFISREHPNDPILTDIDAMYDRNKTQYETMHGQFEHVLKSCGSKIVQDMEYLNTTN